MLGLAQKINERFRYNWPRRFESITSIRYMERVNANDDLFGDLYASRAERATLDSLSQGARDWLLETPFTEWFLAEVREATSDALARTFQRTVSGEYEPMDNIVSPFSDREERLTFDGGRIRRGLKLGLRPFRVSSPYAFTTYGFRDGGGEEYLAVSLRQYLHRWNPSEPRTELLARVPLGIRDFAVAGGLRYEPERNHRDTFSVVFGTEGRIGGGIMFLRLDSSGGIIASFSKFF